ncbi:MAG: hypothetical protein KKA81_12460 [Bacteroidetes bacterium]|nr:hypothetical protein [Bacteroidota bacterium]
MQTTERNKQIHPASLIGTLLKIDKNLDPEWLQQRYSSFLLNGSHGFDPELYGIFRNESIITQLTVFAKYNYEYSIIQNNPDKRNHIQVLFHAYKPESVNQDETPNLFRILNLIKWSDFNLNNEIVRIILERILLDYKLHLAVYSKESAIIANLSDELEALTGGSSEMRSAYIYKYRELRSNFANLEDEINQYNETEKKMDEIEMDFLEKAGELEISYRELFIEAQKLQWKLKFKKLNPDTSEEDVEQQLNVAMKEWSEELNRIAELQAQTKEAKLHKAYEQSFLKSSYAASSDSGTRSDNYLRMLKSESRRESKKTIKLAHPDILNNHVYYDSLTDLQKVEIEKLRDEELERLEKIDKYSSKMSSEYYMQLIEKSKEVRDKIERILKFSGIPVNPDFVIEGKSLSERMKDMDERMRRINIKIFEWKTKRANLPKDDEKKRRLGIMQNNGLETYVSSLKMLISPLKKKVNEMSQAYFAVDVGRKMELKRKEFENTFKVDLSGELIDTLFNLIQQFVKNKPLEDISIRTLREACAICKQSGNKEVKPDHLISALAQIIGLDKKDVYKYYLD